MQNPALLQGPITVVVVFSVEPEKQQALLDRLLSFSEQVVKHRSGFLSARAHLGIDGKSIINVAHWNSMEAFLALTRSPEGQADIAASEQLAQKVTAYICRSTDEIVPLA